MAGVSMTDGIKGRTDAVDATAGNLGENLVSFVTSNTNTGATGVTYDATTLTLSAGDYNVYGSFSLLANGATFTSTDLRFGIHPTTATGGVFGITQTEAIGVIPTTFTDITLPTPVVRVKYDGTTMTVYDSAAGTTYSGTSGVIRLTARVAAYSAGQPVYRCVLRADRRQ